MNTTINKDMMTKEVYIQKNCREGGGQSLLLRLALLLCLVVGGVNGTWADITVSLNSTLNVPGYVAKKYYNFQDANCDANIPTEGDLRYRDKFGLHNFGGGQRNTDVNIALAAGDLLILQVYNSQTYEENTSVTSGTYNTTLSASTKFSCFDISTTTSTVNISVARGWGVAAALVMEPAPTWHATVYANNGTTNIGTLFDGLITQGQSQVIAYSKYILHQQTLYNVAKNSGTEGYYRKTITPTGDNYVESINYNNGSTSHVIYYTEAEDIEGITIGNGGNTMSRSSNAQIGYTATSGANAFVNVTTIPNKGKYKIYLGGTTSNSGARPFSFKINENAVYTGNIAGSSNEWSDTSEEFEVNTEGAQLSVACEGNASNGMDYFYIQKTAAYYTVKFVDQEGNKVKDDMTLSGVPGAEIANQDDFTALLTNIYDKPTMTRYEYDSYSAAPEATISIDNETVVTVKFNKAAISYEFTSTDNVAYIEDIYFDSPINNTTGEAVTYSITGDNATYTRQEGGRFFLRKTTGSEPTNTTEGDALTVTAHVDGYTDITYTLRVKTRANDLDPQTWVSDDKKSWEVPSGTLGMLTSNSNTVTMNNLTMTIGNAAETQVARSIGGGNALTSIDGNGYTFKEWEVDNPSGSFYLFKPEIDGILTVEGYFDGDGKARLYNGSKDIGTIDNGTGLASAEFKVSKDITYYLYGQDGTTFALKSVKFISNVTDTETINISDLMLRSGLTASDPKDRSIPKWDITFEGDNRTDNENSISLYGGGSASGRIAIKPRLSEGDANNVVINSVSLTFDANNGGPSIRVVSKDDNNPCDAQSSNIDTATWTAGASTNGWRGEDRHELYIANGSSDAPKYARITKIEFTYTATDVVFDEKKQTPTITFDPDTYIKGEGEFSVPLPTISPDNLRGISYTCTEGGSTITEENGALTVNFSGTESVFKASFEGTKHFNAAEGSFTVKPIAYIDFSYPSYDGIYPYATIFVGDETALPTLKVTDTQTGEDITTQFTPAYSIESGSSITLDDDGKATGVSDGLSLVKVTLTSSDIEKYPNQKATAKVDVLEFPHTWDFTTAYTSGINLTGFDNTSNQYFSLDGNSGIVPGKNGDEVVSPLRGLGLKGSLRVYKNGSNNGIYLLTGGTLRVPVKEGMEIEIEGWASNNGATDVTISNATDIMGTGKAIIDFPKGESGVRYYLAQSDGYIDIPVTNTNWLHITKLTLQEPKLHFRDNAIVVGPGDETTVEYSNEVINAAHPGSVTYSLTEESRTYVPGWENNFNTETGTFSAGCFYLPSRTDVATVTVVATDPEATGNQPKMGTYDIKVVRFAFPQETYSQVLSGGSVTIKSASDNEKILPSNIEKLGTGIIVDYKVEAPSNVRAKITRDAGSNDYVLTATGVGDITLTASSGLVHASCTIKITGKAFTNPTPAITKPADGTYDLSGKVSDMSSPTFKIFETAGEVGSVSISDNKIITGISGPGAIKVSAKEDGEDGETVYMTLTIAYPAESYENSKNWNFNQSLGGLSITEKDKTTVPSLKSERGAALPTPTTFTDNNDKKWTAKYKNVNEKRDQRWFFDEMVTGDNAFVISQSTGLIFDTGASGFYMQNDKNRFTHVGIHGDASFTVPCLKEGDFIEINWKRDAAGSGATFTATNVADLNGNDVNPETTFSITGSQNGSNYLTNPGLTTFIAKGGDATFTLKDGGYTDILAVRIYNNGYNTVAEASKNGYHITMGEIRQVTLDETKSQEPGTEDLGTASTTLETGLLLDNAADGYYYDICNNMQSTNVGPALYVIKGFDETKEAGKFNTGVNAEKDNPTTYNKDANGYPVPDAAEKAKLLNARKNLKNLHVDNVHRKSKNNSYNVGHIWAEGGYGKVTVRLNNYTEDMQYLIGYTPDYTLTFGSAPHQEYPHSWDFTNISGGTVAGATDNVATSIKNDGKYQDGLASWTSPTWTDNGGGSFTVKTDNSGEDGSQYVPGATLVTTDNDLGAKGNIDSKATLQSATAAVADELNGLGFAGQVTIHTAGASSARGTRAPGTTSYAPLECVTATTITVPDVNAGGKQDWIYVSATQSDDVTVTNATRVTEGSDGPDANGDNLVTKWKVSSPGACNITFPAGTKVYKIGVTNILKKMTPVGDVAWATESRDHAIDHTLTGYFTKNDVNAYGVKYDSYDLETATVELSDEIEVVPKYEGVVLRADPGTDIDKAYSNSEKTVLGETAHWVPLFYPSMTTPESSMPTDNMLVPTTDGTNDGRTFDNGGDKTGDYTYFFLTSLYHAYKPGDGGKDIKPTEKADVAGFYRYHWIDGGTASNTIGPNMAYLRVPTKDLPKAIWWQEGSSNARRGAISIRNASRGDETGIEEVGEWTFTEADGAAGHGTERWYTVSGQRIERPKRPGLYILNGKKVVVKGKE